MATIKRVNRSIGSKTKATKRTLTETRQVHDSRRWRDVVRPMFLKQNPLCVKCQSVGAIVEATEVDHVKPIAFGGDKYSASNLQALCKSCHSRKTARELGARSQGRGSASEGRGEGKSTTKRL